MLHIQKFLYLHLQLEQQYKSRL